MSAQSSHPNTLSQFLQSFQPLLAHYHQSREGQLTIDFTKENTHGSGEVNYKITPHGFLHDPFYVPKKDFENYCRQLSGVPSAIQASFICLEEGVLEILQRTGYGQLVLLFRKEKRNQIDFQCRVMVSHRRLIQTQY
ncbi:MAG: hypothetical protein ACFBSC_17085 [Microcoleaceae cyanobacterium]